jgi:outer membrane protein OmpA-like peptidoglycan-associated protein
VDKIINFPLNPITDFKHEYCDNLSSERARNVVKYLISRGVKPGQLSSKGYGKRAPIADNSTESGRKNESKG